MSTHGPVLVVADLTISQQLACVTVTHVTDASIFVNATDATEVEAPTTHMNDVVETRGMNLGLTAISCPC